MHFTFLNVWQRQHVHEISLSHQSSMRAGPAEKRTMIPKAPAPPLLFASWDLKIGSADPDTALHTRATKHMTNTKLFPPPTSISPRYLRKFKSTNFYTQNLHRNRHSRLKCETWWGQRWTQEHRYNFHCPIRHPWRDITINKLDSTWNSRHYDKK